jgi:hypothetical protein
MGLAFLSVRPERFDLRALDMAAQNVAQCDDISTREWNPKTLRVCPLRPRDNQAILGF